MLTEEKKALYKEAFAILTEANRILLSARMKHEAFMKTV